MAESDKIRSKDIIQQDIFENTIDSANNLITVLNNLQKEFVEIANAQAKIAQKSSKKMTNADDIKKTTKALSEAQKARKRANDTEKEKIKLQEKLKRLNSSAIDQNTELKVQIQEQNKVNKQLAREKLGLVGAYEKEAKKLAELRKRYKDTVIAEGESSKSAKKLGAEVRQLDKKLKDVDASAGQFQRNVGNYPNALGKAKKALVGFAGALGVTAGLTGLVNVFRNSVKIAKDFEQGNANLAAVLGTTSSQITELTQDAKRLGAATSFSATQVSQLQTEFAKLGFTQGQILNATEATLSLAAATGSDLASAAAIAGSTLGGFGLEADQTQRVVDVMAKSFSTSALDIEKFRESMKDAAPAAKAVGIDVEETTALLGTLANAGIAGSKAGTALRAAFINLNKAGLTLEEGLEKVANSNDKLGAATELVGKNAASAFLVLADGTKVTEELEKGLRMAGGAAERMAEEQLNTLEGRLTILNSAWEGFVLGLLSGDSAFSKLSKTIVEGATAMLNFFTATEKQSDALIKQKIETDKLVGAITNVNNTEETRRKLIEELNKKYPKFLENLDKEKVTNEQLLSRLKEVNNELTKKILIKKREEELTDLIERQIDLQISELDIIQDLSEAQRKYDKFKGVTVKRNGELVDSGEKYLEQLSAEAAELARNRDKQEDIRKEIEELTNVYDLITPKTEENTDAKDDNSEATVKQTMAQAKLNEEYRDLIPLFSRVALKIDQVREAKEEELTVQEELQKALDAELLKRREIDGSISDSIKAEIEADKARLKSKVETSRAISRLLDQAQSTDEDTQRAIQAAQKALAISEILINLQGEISGIRRANANKENREELNRIQIGEARTTALLGAATVLAQGSFYEGTELVERDLKGAKVHSGRDGYNINVDGSERIMTGSQNIKTGDLTNDELADIALMYNKGQLVNPMTDYNLTISEKKQDKTHLIVNGLMELKAEIANKPVQQVNVDSFGNLVEVVYRNGVKDTTKYKGKNWI